MTTSQVIQIVIGMIACLMGYSMFRSMLPLWGFILGGWIAFTFMPSVISGPENQQLLYQAGAFVIGGVIGALIAVPLYFAIIFLSGAALGMIVGVMFGALLEVGGLFTVAQITRFINMAFPPIPQTFWQYALMFVAGAILGVMALNFQRFMITASSSFMGSAAIVTGISFYLKSLAGPGAGQALVMMLAWILIGFVGMVIQFQLTGDI